MTANHYHGIRLCIAASLAIHLECCVRSHVQRHSICLHQEVCQLQHCLRLVYYTCKSNSRQ